MRVEASNAIRSILKQTGDLKQVPDTHAVMFRGAKGIVGRRDSQTHLVHWYPAKMFHRIPREILNALEPDKGSIILDPFCGSGTVLLEGALRGHRTIGIDINPLARSISRVKTSRLDPIQLEHHAKEILLNASRIRSAVEPNTVLEFWFKPEARAALHQLWQAIDCLDEKAYREFFLVTFTSIIRRVSLADPSIAPPVRLNPERAARANPRYRRALLWSQSVNSKTVFSEFERAANQNVRRMRELNQVNELGNARVLSGRREAARTGLKSGSVDIILTSPPYCGAQKYVRSLRLEMLWVGMPTDLIATVDRQTLGTERVSKQRKLGDLQTIDEDANQLIARIYRRNPARAIMVSDYITYLNDFVTECRRVLRPGGNAFITFGTSHISGLKVDMAYYCRRAAKMQGLQPLTTLIDRIPSRGLITKRHATAGRIDDEKVVWLRG